MPEDLTLSQHYIRESFGRIPLLDPRGRRTQQRTVHHPKRLYLITEILLGPEGLLFMSYSCKRGGFSHPPLWIPAWVLERRLSEGDLHEGSFWRRAPRIDTCEGVKARG